jgi:cytochrome b involved in lipid metabolism
VYSSIYFSIEMDAPLFFGIAGVTSLVAAHTAWAVHRFGLGRALQLSLARKGSFTSPVDPRRWWAGMLHFWAIWGDAATSTPENSAANTARWHGWYYEQTGDVNTKRGDHVSASALASAMESRVQSLPLVTQAELRRHTSRSSCWICLDGLVFDVTEWLRRHPGGPSVLIRRGGTDVSREFRLIGHSARALAVARVMLIGKLAPPARL